MRFRTRALAIGVAGEVDDEAEDGVEQRHPDDRAVGENVEPPDRHLAAVRALIPSLEARLRPAEPESPEEGKAA